MKSENITLEELTDLDKRILLSIFGTKETNLRVISKKIGVSKSAVHQCIRKLRREKILQGVVPMMNRSDIDRGITAISLISAKHGPGYGRAIGYRIAKIKGVWAVYFVLGSKDFVALVRAKDRGELESISNEFSKVIGIERSETILVLKIEKEDYSESLSLVV